ncbi:MAG: N-acetyltransferase [Betaproteobacteria bacterium HGW-Betaproteobacteria-2]|jgi:predicted N-acetyltransferase YhbS|nr:MAG: N-acetyltransferase [Betaproteobacteria bacterium HGW-Betaproteobacteria-2]
MIFLPLNSQHDRKAFDCGNEDLNRWFKQVARQHKDRGVSSTFVAVADNASIEVLGYYAITVAELVNVDLPAQYQKRLPARVPVFRLGRLAVSVRHQGQRVGEALLFDAIDRITRISQEVGGIGIVVNAKPAAVDFYKQYGFEQMPDHPLNLFLTI